jgi:hypothetical protein
MKKNSTIIRKALFAAAFCPIASFTSSAATLVGLWEFENSSNLAQATVGSALTLNGTTSSTTGVGGDGAINVANGVANYISVSNTIGANGASGVPTRTNQFTIVLDFLVPDFDDGGADNGQFTGIFDFDNGGSDGDYFIRKQANVAELGLGTAGTWNYVGAGATTGNNGAAGTVLANTWYRLVLTANNGVAGESSVFLNGTLIGDHAVGTIDAARRSLGSNFRVAWDNTATENSQIQISNLALYDGRLTDSEVVALGVAGAAIPEPASWLLASLSGLSFALVRRRK